MRYTLLQNDDPVSTQPLRPIEPFVGELDQVMGWERGKASPENRPVGIPGTT